MAAPGQGTEVKALTLSRRGVTGVYGAYLEPFKTVFNQWAFEYTTTGRLKVWNGSTWL